jgi:hypothetical protein
MRLNAYYWWFYMSKSGLILVSDIGYCKIMIYLLLLQTEIMMCWRRFSYTVYDYPTLNHNDEQGSFLSFY